MVLRRRNRIEIKSAVEVERMRAAGLVVADTLELMRQSACPGMTTRDLDALAASAISGAGATPSFLGYHGYPATICVSVNEEIVHGIPGDRTINDGDLVSVDCGPIVDGWHGDAAVTICVGEVADEHHLVEGVAGNGGDDRHHHHHQDQNCRSHPWTLGNR